MSHEWHEAHEMWCLKIANEKQFEMIAWIPLTITNEVAECLDSLEASCFRSIGIIHFKTMDDITYFRLRCGV